MKNNSTTTTKDKPIRYIIKDNETYKLIDLRKHDIPQELINNIMVNY